MTLLVATRPNLNLRVKEVDGTPDVPGVSVVVVSNGTLTNDGGGQVTLNTGGGTTLPVVDETAIVYKTGSPAITATFDAAPLTAARTYSLPDASSRIAVWDAINVYSKVQAITGSGVYFAVTSTGGSAPYLGVTSSTGQFGALLAGGTGSTFQFNKNGTFYIHAADSVSDASIDADHCLTMTGIASAVSKFGFNSLSPAAVLHADQSSTTAAIPVILLDQADLSEEFIRFVSTVGAGNPIDTAALGAYYGKVRVYVEGVGAKWLALYD